MSNLLKFILPALSCGFLTGFNSFGQTPGDHATEVMRIFNDPSDKQILVAAHRADWRNAPENSLEAIQLCIDMGVDIAEIDVQLTKDGKLILMHDKSVERMTDGKGDIKDFTLEQIQALHLKNAYGVITRFKIPTLEEVLNLSKGKIVLFIDKCYPHIPLILSELEKTGTTHQALLEGKATYTETLLKYPQIQTLGVKYMPRVGVEEQVTALLAEETKPETIIISFKKEKSPVLQRLNAANKESYRLLVSTLWPETCANHDDDLALSDPESSWGWVVTHGAGIICTDRPGLLLTYLKKKNLHR